MEQQEKTMNKLIYISKIILFAVFCSLCSHLAAQQVVAILEPVAGPGVAPISINAVWSTMFDFLTESKSYTVVDRSRSKLVLNELHLQENSPMNVNNRDTATAIGNRLNANIICVSEITQGMGQTNIRIHLIDLKTNVIPRSASGTVRSIDPTVIADTVDTLMSRITGLEGKLQRAKREELRAENKEKRSNRAFGIYVSGGLPIGEFGTMEFPPTSEFPVVQSEGHDFGYGGRITLTFPLYFKLLGIRLGGGFIMNNGANTAPGYDTIDLTYTAISASGELQIFFGDSRLHQGTYLFGGATINQESFGRSSDGFTDTYRKMRLGGTAGIGHTFSKKDGAGGWTLEVAYHTTLASKDVNIGEAVAVDYVRFSIGVVF